VWKISEPWDRFGATRGADRHDHEFLDVDRLSDITPPLTMFIIGTGNVRRKRRRHSEERLVELVARPLAQAEAARSTALAPRAGFCSGVPSSSIRVRSILQLIAASKPEQRVEDFAIDRSPPVAPRPPKRFAARAFRRLHEPRSRRPTHRRTPIAPLSSGDIDLDGRVAAAVEDLAGMDNRQSRSSGQLPMDPLTQMRSGGRRATAAG